MHFCQRKAAMPNTIDLLIALWMKGDLHTHLHQYSGGDSWVRSSSLLLWLLGRAGRTDWIGRQVFGRRHLVSAQARTFLRSSCSYQVDENVNQSVSHLEWEGLLLWRRRVWYSVTAMIRDMEENAPVAAAAAAAASDHRLCVCVIESELRGFFCPFIFPLCRRPLFPRGRQPVPLFGGKYCMTIRKRQPLSVYGRNLTSTRTWSASALSRIIRSHWVRVSCHCLPSPSRGCSGLIREEFFHSAISIILALAFSLRHPFSWFQGWENRTRCRPFSPLYQDQNAWFRLKEGLSFHSDGKIIIIPAPGHKKVGNMDGRGRRGNRRSGDPVAKEIR